MENLPIEIIKEHIIPFTYCPQPKELLEDIVSFYNTREYLINTYKNRWSEFADEDPNEWLENDIIRYLNEDKATMWGFVDSCVSKFSRLFLFMNQKNVIIRRFVYSFLSGMGEQQDKIKRVINCSIGILTVFERERLNDFANTLDYYNDQQALNLLNTAQL